MEVIFLWGAASFFIPSKANCCCWNLLFTLLVLEFMQLCSEHWWNRLCVSYFFFSFNTYIFLHNLILLSFQCVEWKMQRKICQEWNGLGMENRNLKGQLGLRTWHLGGMTFFWAALHQPLERVVCHFESTWKIHIIIKMLNVSSKHHRLSLDSSVPSGQADWAIPQGLARGLGFSLPVLEEIIK